LTFYFHTFIFINTKPPIKMTNEEIIEELYWSAHRAGVFDEFRGEIGKITKNNPKTSMIDAAEQVYRRFRQEGLIRDGRNINHHQVIQ
jgi:hypothetical protein